MKITFYCPTLALGGAEVVTINLCNEFYRLGHDVTFLCLNANGKLKNRLAPKVKLVSLNSSRSRYALFKLYSYLIKNRPDYLISTLRDANIASSIVFRFPFIKTKLIIREAGLIDFSQYSFLNKFLYNFIFNIFYSSDYKYIFNSVGTLNSFMDLNIIKVEYKYTVIGNPLIDKNIFLKSNENVDHKWLNGKYFVLVSVGRLHIVKDQLTLLRAFNIVLKKHPMVKLIVIGEGPEKESLIKYILDNDLNNSVDLLGYVDNPIKYIKKANLFVLTSKSEGFGNVLVETLACEKWIISTNCLGGVSEVLNNGEFGSLCKVGSFIEIANAVIKFIDGKILFEPDKQKNRSLSYSVNNISESYFKFIVD